MKNSRAFTLIEVMVVLSILAIIAILAYNFFGNTMKEASIKQATTKVYNDLRVMADAVEMYKIKNGVYPPHYQMGDLVTDGQLKARPIGDVNWALNGGSPADYEIAVNGDVYYDMDGNGIEDFFLTGYFFKQELCEAFNRAYSAPPLNDGTIYDYFSSGPPGKTLPVLAMSDTATFMSSGCIIIWMLEYK